MSDVGRPTLYKPEYCQDVIEWGKQGKSLAWMAATLDVSRECIYEWMRVHPDFSDSMTRARLHSQKWWEDFGQDNLIMPHQSGTFNGTVWQKNMAARFADDWREKTETTHAGEIAVTSLKRTVVDPKGESNV